MFKERVQLQDSDEYDPSDPSKIKKLSRSAVLPLPRSIDEAVEWGSRLVMTCIHRKVFQNKLFMIISIISSYPKGTRVYAMYPSTTSFYPATVVDNAMFDLQRNTKEGILVVQFDDEGKSKSYF